MCIFYILKCWILIGQTVYIYPFFFLITAALSVEQLQISGFHSNRDVQDDGEVFCEEK